MTIEDLRLDLPSRAEAATGGADHPAGSRVEPYRPWLIRFAWLWLVVALVILLPVTALSFDVSLLDGGVRRWLEWRASPFMFWKFGTPYLLLLTWGYLAHYCLSAIGFSPVVAIHLAYKIPLVIALGYTGVLFGRLAQTFGYRSPNAIKLAWIFSPVGLWVAAGQIQIEPVTALSIVASVYLIRTRKRFWLAGLSAGFGFGVEYVPALILMYVLVLRRWGVLTTRQCAKIGLGFVAASSVSFAPNLVTRLGRQALFLAPQIGGNPSKSPNLVTSNSVWRVLRGLGVPGSVVDHWLPITVIVVVLIFGVGCISRFRFLKEEPHPPGVSAEWSLAVAVIALVLLDPTTLPQYALLVQMALVLLVCLSVMSLTGALLIPVAAVASWFAQWNWYQFVLDIRPTVYSHLPHLLPVPSGNFRTPVPPFDQRLSNIVGEVFSLGTILALIAHKARARFNERRLPALLLVELIVLGPVVVWAGQPYFTSQLFGSQPTHLYDDALWVSPLPIPLKVDKQGITLEPGNRALALQGTDPLPRIDLNAQFRPIYSQTGVGRSTNEPISLVLSHWQEIRPEVNTLWINLLLHSNRWGNPSAAVRFPVRLVISGRLIDRSIAGWVQPQWVTESFRVPSSVIPMAGGPVTFSFSSPGLSLLDNSSLSNRPWLSVYPAAGKLNMQNQAGQPLSRKYSSNPWGTTVISNAWSARSLGASVNFEDLLASGYVQSVGSAQAVWPDHGSRVKSPVTYALGSLFLTTNAVGALCLVRRWRRDSREFLEHA